MVSRPSLLVDESDAEREALVRDHPAEGAFQEECPPVGEAVPEADDSSGPRVQLAVDDLRTVRAEPALEVFGLRPDLEDERARGVEHPLDDLVAGGDVTIVASSSGHCPSPFRPLPCASPGARPGTRRVDRSSSPRRGGIRRSTPRPLATGPRPAGTGATAPPGRGR